MVLTTILFCLIIFLCLNFYSRLKSHITNQLLTSISVDIIQLLTYVEVDMECYLRIESYISAFHGGMKCRENYI